MQSNWSNQLILIAIQLEPIVSLLALIKVKKMELDNIFLLSDNYSFVNRHQSIMNIRFQLRSQWIWINVGGSYSVKSPYERLNITVASNALIR